MGQASSLETFPTDLARESWALYGVGMFIILLRSYARWRRARHFSELAPDDWIMMTAVPAFYTTLIVCLNAIASGGGSNLYLPEEYATFTPEDIEERIKGSKIVIVSEQAMLNVIWSLKACMLFMYARMTVGTTHLKFVRYLSIYVALGWVGVELTFFTACRPFKGYWAVPPPNPQCTTIQHYSIVQAIFNLSSDVCMLLIPLPMVLSLSLPLKQKLVLAIVFSMGIFVIIAAILTKVFNLSDVYDIAYMFWYVREASVAVYVANLPGIWPLLREHIRFLRSGNSYPTNGRPDTSNKYGNLSSSHMQSRTGRSRSERIGKESDIELGRRSFSKSTTATRSTSLHRNERDPRDEEERVGHFSRKFDGLAATLRRGSLESDERVLAGDSGDLGSGWGKVGNLEVHVDKTIEVQRGSWDLGRKKQFEEWEVRTDAVYAPKVRIEGPDGEVVEKKGGEY